MTRAGAAVLAIVALCGGAAAEPLATPWFGLPNFVDQADTPEGFAPKGWKIERLVRGDLNGDGRSDAALAMRGGDPRMIVQNPSGVGAREVDANPRAVVVVFAERGGFRWVSAGFGILPAQNDPELRDPFVREAFRIAGGQLHVTLVRAKRSGGEETRRVSYRFRHIHDSMRAARYERRDAVGATGEFETLVVDVVGRVGTRTVERAGAVLKRESWPLDRVKNGVEFNIGGVDIGTPSNGLEFSHAY